MRAGVEASSKVTLGDGAMFALGAVGAGFSGGIVAKALAVRRWPEVRGLLLERGVGESAIPDESAGFEPRVRCRYEVDGRRFEGTRVYPVSTAYVRAGAEALVASLPEAPMVRYDPRRPAESCLLPTPLAVPVVALVSSVLAMLLAIARLS